MKRKISAPNPNYPMRTRIPSPRGFHGIRNSDFPIAPPPRTADNAKTSEYAFFKKLKEGANNTSQSYSLHKEVYETRNLKPKDCSRERMTMNTVENKRVEMRSSFLNEKGTPQLHMKGSCAALEDVHGKKHDVVEEYGSALRTEGKSLTRFEESEAENTNADVFDRKRRKLRQWVTETSFPEIDELCSKGYDFASVLLSRLVPNCNENNKLKDRKLLQAETNGKFMSLPSYESDSHFKKLPWTPTCNFMELEYGPCLHDTTPSCWPNAYKERITCSDSPTNYTYKNHLQYRVWEPDFELPGGSAISCTKSHSQYGLPFFGNGLSASEHVEEMDVFSQPNEYFVERELSVPMLGWDYGSTKEDRNLSNLTRYRAEQTSASLASYHSHDILRHGLADKDDIRSGFHQIPLTLSCMPNFIDLAEDYTDETACEVGSTIFSLQNDHWFRSKVIKEGHYLPNTETLLSSGLDFDLGWKYIPLSDSLREHYSSTRHGLLFPEHEDRSSRLLTFDEDKHERSLEDYSSHTRSFAHFIEDDVSIHEGSTFCPQISLDRKKASSSPFLLDNSSWDGSERELNFDDNDANICVSSASFR